MSAHIRPITLADNAQVAQILHTVMTEFDCVGEAYSIADPEVNDMFAAYAGDQAAYFVIEKEGEVLGCGGFAHLAGGEAGICELKKMYFLPALRGLGMGQKLLTHCIAAAKKAGYHTMYLETVERMTAANALYQKNGFSPLKRACGATGHGGCDTFYQKALS